MVRKVVVESMWEPRKLPSCCMVDLMWQGFRGKKKERLVGEIKPGKQGWETFWTMKIWGLLGQSSQ